MNRIAVVGSPSRPTVEWTAERLTALYQDGFTAVQLNIAWGWRPADEPLNLEDVVPLAGVRLPGGAKPGDEAWLRRRGDLAARAKVAKAAGLDTIFHFGAPYTARSGYADEALPQCVSDPATTARYVELLAQLATDFPDVDDLLLYVYDQDAWICSEFGDCPRCRAVPLHLRVTPFVNALAAAWRRARPGRRLWWEPWELSSGQLTASIEHLDPTAVGLMLHSSVAEVASALPADRAFRNAASSAAARGIPVVGEVFLSSANEEVEPLQHVPAPAVTLRQLRDVERVPGVRGVKEYYGLMLEPGDANYAAAVEYFRDPGAPDEELLRRAAERYAPAGSQVVRCWLTMSSAYEQYPWDVSWFARQLGRSMPAHAMTAAIVRGMQTGMPPWHTPSWRSSRGAVFIRVENGPVDPWLLEDLGLRCERAADLADRAATRAGEALALLDDPTLAAELDDARTDIVRFAVRARAYALHARQTTLAMSMRRQLAEDSAIDELLIARMRELLVADLDNQRRLPATSPAPPDPSTAPDLLLDQAWAVPEGPWVDEITPSIEALDRDVATFLATYFMPATDTASRGQFSLTST